MSGESSETCQSVMDLYLYKIIELPDGRVRLEGHLGSEDGPLWRTRAVKQIKGSFATTFGDKVYRLVSEKPEPKDVDEESLESHFVESDSNRMPTEFERKSLLLQRKREELAVLEEELTELGGPLSTSGIVYNTPRSHHSITPSLRRVETPHRRVETPHRKVETPQSIQPISVESWLKHTASNVTPSSVTSHKLVSPTMKVTSQRKSQMLNQSYNEMPPPSVPRYTENTSRSRREIVQSPGSPVLPPPKARSTGRHSAQSLTKRDVLLSMDDVDDDTLHSVPISSHLRPKRRSLTRQDGDDHVKSQRMQVDDELEDWSRKEVQLFDDVLEFVRRRKFRSDKDYFKAISKYVGTKTWRQCAHHLEMVQNRQVDQETVSKMSSKSDRQAPSTIQTLTESPASHRKQRSGDERLANSARVESRSKHTNRSRRVRPDKELGVTYVKSPQHVDKHYGGRQRSRSVDNVEEDTLSSVATSSAMRTKSHTSARLQEQEGNGRKTSLRSHSQVKRSGDEQEEWTREEIRVFQDVIAFMAAKHFRTDEGYFKAMARHIGTKTWQQCADRFNSRAEQENSLKKQRRSRGVDSGTKGRLAETRHCGEREEEESSGIIPLIEEWDSQPQRAKQGGESRRLSRTYVKSPRDLMEEEQRSVKVKLAGKKTWKRREQLAELADKINEGYSPSLFDEGVTPNKNRRYKLPAIDLTPLNMASGSGVNSERRRLLSPDDISPERSRDRQRKARKNKDRFLQKLPMKEQWPVKLSQRVSSVSKRKSHAAGSTSSGNRVRSYLREMDNNVDDGESEEDASECYYTDDD